MSMVVGRVLIVWRRRVSVLAAAVVVAAGLGVVQAQSAPASGILSVTDYTTPASHPFGIALDKAGRVWVAMPECDAPTTCTTSSAPGKLGRFDPSTQKWSTTVTLRPGWGQPLFVALDAAGKVWFTMPITNAIGVYDPLSGALAQWPVPTPNSSPWGLAFDHDGVLWFTEHSSNKVGSFDPVSRTFTEIATPTADSHPYGVTVDGANNVWFTENNDAVALIAKVTDGVLTEYKIRDEPTAGTGLTPHLITTDRFGNVWWTEGFAAAIGKLVVSQAQPGTNNGVTEFPYDAPCCGAHTSGIAADSQGNIWITDSLRFTFGMLPVGGDRFTFYNSQKIHPHDGVAIDAKGGIWFAEEMGNGLAQVVPSTTLPGIQVGGGVVLDGFGGLHPFSVGGAPAPAGPFTGTPYWRGWDIARGVALLPGASGTASPGGYVLDGYGGLHAFGTGGGAAPQGKVFGSYWRGWDIARGIALMPGPKPSGGFMVDAWGGLHWFSIGSPAPAPRVNASPGTYNSSRAVARGVFINKDGAGGYVVDASGGMHPFAINQARMPSGTIGGGASWRGRDMARGATQAESSDGLLLDAYGGLYPFWFGDTAPAKPNITGAPYWRGWPIARGIGM
jgi:streptogramin lyase